MKQLMKKLNQAGYTEEEVRKNWEQYQAEGYEYTAWKELMRTVVKNH